MADRFGKYVITLESPVTDAFEITPSDSTTFSQPTRGVYVGTSGNLKVMMAGTTANTVLTLTGLTAGVIHPLRIQRVYSGNTTAAQIVGFY